MPPFALEARGVACDQVNLRWLAPVGDSAPTAYDIYRDGIRIGGSETSHYVDRDPALTPATSYEYYVVALRAGALESPRSLSSVGETLATGEGFYEVLSTENPPVIDGDVSDFSGGWPAYYATSTGGAAAIFIALWDDTALYVAYAIADTDLQAICTENDNGSVWNDDAVELFLDLGGEDPDAPADTVYMDGTDYQLILNLLSARYDLRGDPAQPTIAPEPSLWNGDWETAVEPHGTLGDATDSDLGYSIEARISWASLGIAPPSPGKPIGMSFTVSDLDANDVFDWQMWPELPTTSAHQNSANWQAAVLASAPVP